MRRRCPPPSRRGCRLAVAGKHGGALCRSVQVVFGWMSFFPGRSQPFDPLGHKSSRLHWPYLQGEGVEGWGEKPEGSSYPQLVERCGLLSLCPPFI